MLPVYSVTNVPGLYPAICLGYRNALGALPCRPVGPYLSSMQIDYDVQGLKAAGDRLGLRLVVLFGSRGEGRKSPGPDSDLDLAILPRISDRVDLLEIYREMGMVFSKFSVDVMLLGKADPLLRFEVMRAGELLYGDALVFLEYKCFAFKDFVDSADLRATEQALHNKKMAFIRGELSAAS